MNKLSQYYVEQGFSLAFFPTMRTPFYRKPEPRSSWRGVGEGLPY